MDKPPHRSHQPLRLNKFLAERLGLSRREADDLIAAGKITINGRVAQLGDKIDLSRKRAKTNQDLFSERRREDNIPERNIDKNDEVCYNGKIIPLQADFLYLAFNKPVGYVCSRRAQGPAPTLYDLLPPKYHHLKTVGRLDKDSSGLILLTNDGDFAFQMTHPKFRKNKVYEVELDRPLAPLHQQMIMEFGVEIGDGLSKFKIVRDDLATSPNCYIVVLSEGRNRQIRRTFAALGYQVTRLHRISFGKYELGDLRLGECVIIKP